MQNIIMNNEFIQLKDVVEERNWSEVNHIVMIAALKTGTTAASFHSARNNAESC
jgi:hypothetical protein